MSQPDDPLEKEADQAATAAVAPPGSLLEHGAAIPLPVSSQSVGAAKQTPGPGAADLISRSGPGQPLAWPLRAFFQSRFGRDFRDVRIHTDAAAAESARAIQARAFTAGSDVVFGAGQYDPESHAGRRLLAHELMHVLQQRENASHGTVVQRQQQPQAPPQQPAPATPGTAPNQAATQAAGAPTTIQSLTASATIAAGQVLSADAESTTHTEDATQVTATVTSTRLTVRFTPALIRTMNSFPYANVWIDSFYYDFATARYGVSFEARRATFAAAWLSGPSLGERALAGVGNIFGSLPPAMRLPGYNPFDDPNITSNLSAFLAGLSAGGGGGGPTPVVSDITLSGAAVIGGEVRRDAGSLSVLIPGGTQVSATIRISGGVPASLRDLRVSSVEVTLSSPRGGGPNVSVRVMDTDLPVIFIHSATFTAGGAIHVDYTLATEAIEGLIRILVAAEAAREGAPVGEGALDYRQPRMRALIDAQIRGSLEPLLREIVQTNRYIIAGIDLVEALGYGGGPPGAPQGR